MQDFGAHIIIKKTQAQEYYMPIKALQCVLCTAREDKTVSISHLDALWSKMKE